MTDVQAFSVGRANNTPRDAVWKSDYDKLAAELVALTGDAYQARVRDQAARIRELEAEVAKLRWMRKELEK